MHLLHGVLRIPRVWCSHRLEYLKFPNIIYLGGIPSKTYSSHKILAGCIGYLICPGLDDHARFVN